MKLADVSIARPVFTTMVLTALVIFGAISYSRMNVDRYPEIDFPIVSVQTVYVGASPETMESQVAEPIEEVVASLAGVKAVRSNNLEGVSIVSVEFEIGTDIDIATQDVRDRVASIRTDLPDAIEEPVVEKLDLGAIPVVQIALSSDDASALARYAEDVFKPAMERTDGVGQVELVGGREREVQVYLNPDALRALGITPLEVVGAVGRQNVEIPGGRIEQTANEMSLRTDARFSDVNDMRNLAVRSVGGRVVTLGEIATIVDGYEEERSRALLNGDTAIAVLVRKQSDANAVVASHAARETMAELAATAPAGINVEMVQDNAVSIEASIDTVEFDILLGAVLAIAIILLFLRDIRATIISALALPTSVVGTFVFVSAMGFTINMMTTLALSLSIGVLIDDAIVVIENIVRRKTVLGEGPKEAAAKGTDEIGLAVLATTFSIVAVFVPVAFMEGLIGQFFYEFGLTVAVAVLLSLFVSFTLTPMLSARFLKEHGHEGFVSRQIGKVLGLLDNVYRWAIGFTLRFRMFAMAGAIGILFFTLSLVPNLQSEFEPTEDTGMANVRIEMPVGTSLDATTDAAERIAARVRNIPGVQSTLTTIGGGAQGRVNEALVVVVLDHHSSRSYHVVDFMAYVRAMVADEGEELNISVEAPSGVPTGERNAQMMIALRGDDLDALEQAAQTFAESLRADGQYVDVDTSSRDGAPEIRLTPNRAVADSLGVVNESLASTTYTLLTGTVATQLDLGNDRVDVRVMLPDAQRDSIEAVMTAQVRTGSGALVEVGDVADVSRRAAPSRIDRENRQRQVTVYANLDGIALGNAMANASATLDSTLPEGVTYAFTGQAQHMEESGQAMMFSLMLAVVCIYMILASQFESFIHPFTIMTSLPFSLIGAFGGLLLADATMSIFAMIGIIMLFGLVTKNAILLVDFTTQLRKEGQAVNEALVNAGATRLQPILMTTAAMVGGMFPVALGHGDGGEVRAPMGVVVIGGLISSTVLTLFIVPVVYSIVESVLAFFNRLLGRIRRTAAPAP